MPKTRLHPVDLEIGQRVRRRRKQLGLSQAKLAASLGISFQQIQKYENGQNQLSASRLVFVAKALDVPPSYFFEGLEQVDDGERDKADGRKKGLYLTDPELVELCKAILSLRGERSRRRAMKLARGVVALLENDENLR